MLHHPTATCSHNPYVPSGLNQQNLLLRTMNRHWLPKAHATNLARARANIDRLLPQVLILLIKNMKQIYAEHTDIMHDDLLYQYQND